MSLSVILYGGFSSWFHWGAETVYMKIVSKKHKFSESWKNPVKFQYSIHIKWHLFISSRTHLHFLHHHFLLLLLTATVTSTICCPTLAHIHNCFHFLSLSLPFFLRFFPQFFCSFLRGVDSCLLNVICQCLRLSTLSLSVLFDDYNIWVRRKGDREHSFTLFDDHIN